MKTSVGIVITILVVVLAASIYLNQENIAAQKELEQNAILVIKDNGEKIAQFDMSSIQRLKGEKFQAELRSSGKPAKLRTYQGVPLVWVIEEAKFDLSGKSQVNVTAVDGYAVAFTINEVLDEENIFLVYEMDGEPLGTKATGGVGPYQVVVRKDDFSQRWCKFVVEVDVVD